MTPEEIQDTLDAAAAAPMIVQIDQNNIQQQSLRDQIANADRKANLGKLSGAWGGGARVTRVILPGPTGPRVGA